MILLFWLVGCGSDTGIGAAPAGVDLDTTATVVPVNPSPYVVEDDETDGAEALPLEAVSTGVTSALTAALSLDPRVLFRAHADVMRAGDAACPAVLDDYYTTYGYYYWYATCASDAGTSFDGYGYYYDTTERDYGSYYAHEADYWYGLADIRTGDGQRFEMTGSASYYDYDYPGAYTYYSWSMLGDFVWTGPDYANTWLGQDLSTQLSGWAYRYLSGATAMSLDGSIGGLEGAFDAANLRQVVMISTSAGSNCESEPGGTISVRTSDGEWYDISFDGPKYWGATTFPPDCDGCGRVSHRGVEIGEVCPDLSSLLGWAERPWG